MKLEEIKEIKGKIILKTGLHIGAGDTHMHIGGTDNPVACHPHTKEPYIPGSSIKGKVRALLELLSGMMKYTEGAPVSHETLKNLAEGSDDYKECLALLKLFGASGDAKDDGTKLGPTRVSFSDCFLSADWREKVRQNRLPFTELKSENTINRIEGTAKNPRVTERVPAGAEFDFSVSLKEFAEDKDLELEDMLFKGLKLLEMDALGGSGSRGYGRIEFKFDDPKLNEKLKGSRSGEC